MNSLVYNFKKRISALKESIQYSTPLFNES